VQFLKNFLINLYWLFVFGLIVYLIYPDIIGMVYKTIGQLFGPLVILMIIVVALPSKRTKS
jgi:hypothetical protein